MSSGARIWSTPPPGSCCCGRRWGRPSIEIRPIAELVERFDLADINKASAFFDIKKLDHFNGEYIRMLDLDEFVERSLPFAGDVDPQLSRVLAPGIQERIKRFDEIPELIGWVIGPRPEPQAKEWRKVMEKDLVPDVLDAVTRRLADGPWTAEHIEQVVMGVGDELGTRSQLPIRLAVSGRRAGLPLFEPMAALERDEVLDRLREARGRL